MNRAWILVHLMMFLSLLVTDLAFCTNLGFINYRRWNRLLYSFVRFFSFIFLITLTMRNWRPILFLALWTISLAARSIDIIILWMSDSCNLGGIEGIWILVICLNNLFEQIGLPVHNFKYIWALDRLRQYTWCIVLWL